MRMFKHANDWFDRCDDGTKGKIVSVTDRTITLNLTDTGLEDLISDSEYYVECMHGWWTDGVDYSSAAKRCLKALKKQKLYDGKWSE